MINGNKSNEIGLLQDRIDVPYSFGENSILAHLNTGYYHIHGASFIYPKYAAPVKLTSAAGAWAATGTPAEVIPINAINKAFDLHWASVSAISANLDGIIDIYSSVDGVAFTQIGAIDVLRSATGAREMAMPVQVPQQPENIGIYCRFTDSTSSAQTVRVKFYGHVYGVSL